MNLPPPAHTDFDADGSRSKGCQSDVWAWVLEQCAVKAVLSSSARPEEEEGKYLFSSLSSNILALSDEDARIIIDRVCFSPEFYLAPVQLSLDTKAIRARVPRALNPGGGCKHLYKTTAALDISYHFSPPNSPTSPFTARTGVSN